MDGFEIAYYLNGPQLLLLLSLIDQRPVAGLPSIDEPENWQSVSLSLLQDRRLRFENGQLVMDEDISDLLLAIKNAERIYAVCRKRPEPSVQVLYEGEKTAILELLPDKKTRLRRGEDNALGRLTEELLMPLRPMPDELMDALPDDEIIKGCLDRWTSRRLSPEGDFSLWIQAEEARGVLECLTPETRTRWIWIEDPAASLILRQDQTNTQAMLDTVSQRKSLLRELGLEA